MRIFLSWSQPRSKAIAAALHRWLPRVLQGVEPWMSDLDIEAGVRWSSEIATALEACNFGIVCVTPEALEQPWLHFEAGALAKQVSVSKVVPYVYDLDLAQLQKGPLGSFQGKRANREETFQLVSSINAEAKPRSLDSEALKETFELWWPKLESALKEDAIANAPMVSAPTKPPISNDDIYVLLHQLVQTTDQQGTAIAQLLGRLFTLLQPRTPGGLLGAVGGVSGSLADLEIMRGTGVMERLFGEQQRPRREALDKLSDEPDPAESDKEKD
jgi:hypothetical protein